jgi:predicted O-methyltransferase YrrM
MVVMLGGIRLSRVTASPGNSSAKTNEKTSAKSAPKAASWAYAENFLTESEAAAGARTNAEEFGVSPVGRGTASTLTFLARVVQARHVVEIGTGSGLSGLALFAGMQPDGILTSVDIEADHQRAARSSFLATGIPTQRFRLIAGPALNVLPRLSDGAYDLVLVDADKIEYPAYVEQGIRLLRHGGVLVVDNALWHDRVADPNVNDDETTAIREALAMVAGDEDLVATLLPVGDGLLVAVKR